MVPEVQAVVNAMPGIINLNQAVIRWALLFGPSRTPVDRRSPPFGALPCTGIGMLLLLPACCCRCQACCMAWVVLHGAVLTQISHAARHCTEVRTCNSCTCTCTLHGAGSCNACWRCACILHVAHMSCSSCRVVATKCVVDQLHCVHGVQHVRASMPMRMRYVLVLVPCAQHALIKHIFCANQQIVRMQAVVSMEQVNRTRQWTHIQIRRPLP